MPDDAPPAGRPKGEKRQRTRAALIEAARELTREIGYERTTLEAVARRAGMTTGAIYGNFKNRDELFVAIAQTAWAPIKPVFAPDATFAEKMRALADATIAAIPERRPAAVGYLSGRAYALTHAEMAERARALTAQSYAQGAAWLRAVAGDEDLPMPAEQLVVAIHALTEGLLLQRFLTPELVPDAVFHAAFAALAGQRTPAREP